MHFARCFRSATVFLVLVTLIPVFHASAESQPAIHRFALEEGKFVLDGKPFRIISGEMHYPPIPRAYWRERFRMAKALGLNAVTTYVFWNVHEPHPGVYDFSGNNHVAEFVREAQQEGLYVVLRPGPYVCAEWDSEATLRGCSRIIRWWYAAAIPNMLRRWIAGSRAWARSWHRSKLETGAQFCWFKWRTNTDRLAKTTRTSSSCGNHCSAV